MVFLRIVAFFLSNCYYLAARKLQVVIITIILRIFYNAYLSYLSQKQN